MVSIPLIKIEFMTWLRKKLWQSNCRNQKSEILIFIFLINFAKKTIFEYFIK
jgi:hypothetical protein